MYYIMWAVREIGRGTYDLPTIRFCFVTERNDIIFFVHIYHGAATTAAAALDTDFR